MNKEKILNKKKIVVAVIAFGIGVCAIIFGFCLTRHGGYILHKYYGGDAYTGIQNATADAGNNVLYLEALMQRVFRYAFIITGLGFIFYGVKTLLFNKDNVCQNVNMSGAIIESSETKNNETNLDRLAKLKSLFDNGAIDENEFKAEKEKILNS